MSYDLKLSRPSDYFVIEDDQIPDYDYKTIILNKPITATSNIVVKINDFVRPSEFKNEIIIREDVSDQIVSFSTDTIFVKQGPIYNGLKMGTLATNTEDVTVKIKIVEEDVSAQFTGNEDFFVLEGKPILKFNNYDFSFQVTTSDIIIKKNNVELTHYDIIDVNSALGRVQLKEKPILGDTILVTYYFKAKVKSIDAINSRITLKERSKPGQLTTVQYCGRVKDGWTVVKSQRSIVKDAQDIVFDRNRNTNRTLVIEENVTSQFTGTQNSFFTKNTPLLPLYQSFYDDPNNTLNNAIAVLITRGVESFTTPVERLNAITGEIKLYITPQIGDIVQVTYFYQNELITDRISVDYPVPRKYCSKASGHIDLAEYKVNTLGNYEKVQKEEKLIQDLRKIIVTTRGSDPVATWYGTLFNQYIGTKQIPEYIKTRISSEIVEALTRLKNAQTQQEDYQEVTLEEFLDFIQKIIVEQNIQEPSFYHATVNIVNQAGEAYELNEPIIFKDDRLFAPNTVIQV